MSRLNFRQNWPLLVAGGLLLLLLSIYRIYLFRVWQPNDPLQNVRYWSLVSYPEQIIWIFCGGFWITLFLAILFLWSRRNSYRIIIKLLISLAVFIVGIWIGVQTIIQDGVTLQHINTVSFSGSTYQLAVATYMKPFDWAEQTYYVFQCDDVVKRCSKIAAVPIILWDEYLSTDPKLVVADQKLILSRSFDQTQILPVS